MEIMQKELGATALPDTMINPFTGSYRFKLESAQVDTTIIQSLSDQITSIDGVTGFHYPSDLYQSMRSWLKNVSLLIGAIGGILILLILVMIHHQIRMYIMQHRYHIRTMSLVGATRAYIRKPFISEVLKMSSFSILVAAIGFLLVLLWISHITDYSIFASNLDMVIIGLVFIIALGTLMSFSAAWSAIQRYLESTDARDFI